MRNAFLLAFLLSACGDDGGGASADAAIDGLAVDVPTANPTVTISGKATKRTAAGSTDLEGVMIAAYRNGDDTTPIATTTSDAMGNYTLTAQTNGVAIDAFMPQDEPPRAYPVVVANILAVALDALAGTLAARTAPGGRIAMSGILAGQEGELLQRYAEWFDDLRVARQEDWIRIDGVRR